MTDPASDLDFYDPGFLADPYPALGRVREATPIFRNEADRTMDADPVRRRE